MKTIPLTQGKCALVDDEDFGFLSQWKWYLLVGKYAARTNENRKVIYMHRVLVLAPSNKLVDHLNSNGLDNRRSNLRICTQAQNLANRGAQVNSKSGVKGVCWHKGAKKWMVRVRTEYVGIFGDLKDAMEAYNKKSLLVYGEFAHLSVLNK